MKLKQKNIKKENYVKNESDYIPQLVVKLERCTETDARMIKQENNGNNGSDFMPLLVAKQEHCTESEATELHHTRNLKQENYDKNDSDYIPLLVIKEEHCTDSDDTKLHLPSNKKQENFCKNESDYISQLVVKQEHCTENDATNLHHARILKQENRCKNESDYISQLVVKQEHCPESDATKLHHAGITKQDCSEEKRSKRRKNSQVKNFDCAVNLTRISETEKLPSANLNKKQIISLVEKPDQCINLGQENNICFENLEEKALKTKPFFSGVCKKDCRKDSIMKGCRSAHFTNQMEFQEKIYICGICITRFTNMTYLREHMNSHVTLNQCHKCDNYFPFRNSLIQHQLTPCSKTYQCTYCNKYFMNQQSFREHLDSLTDKTLKNNISSASLKRMRVSDTQSDKSQKLKKYSCNICNKSFSDENCLKSHSCNHLGKKSFTCGMCSKSFKSEFKLSQHKRIHTAGKRFICDICDQSYKRKDHLKIHIFYSHNSKKINSFKCDECSKSFYFKSNLKKHKLVHSGIEIITL